MPTAARDSAPPGARGFHTTHWSIIALASDAQSPGSLAALEKLCRAYWFPLYACVRQRRAGR